MPDVAKADAFGRSMRFSRQLCRGGGRRLGEAMENDCLSWPGTSVVLAGADRKDDMKDLYTRSRNQKRTKDNDMY